MSGSASLPLSFPALKFGAVGAVPAEEDPGDGGAVRLLHRGPLQPNYKGDQRRKLIWHLVDTVR